MSKKTKKADFRFDVLIKMTLGLILIFLVVQIIVTLKYKNKFFPKTYIAGIKVSGLTKEESEKKLKEEVNNYIKKEKLILKVNQQKYTDNVNNLKLKYKIKETIKERFIETHGHAAKLTLHQFVCVLKSIFRGYRYPLKLNREKLKKVYELIEAAAENNLNPKDAEIILNKEEVEIVAAKNGSGIDLQEARELTISHLANLKRGELKLNKRTLIPTIKTEEAKEVKKELEKILAVKTIVLSYRGKKITTLDRKRIFSLLKIKKSTDQKSSPEGAVAAAKEKEFGKENIALSANLKLVFKESNLKMWLKNYDYLLGRPPKNARLTIVGGRVVVAEKEVLGQGINREKFKQELLRALQEKRQEIELVVGKIIPDITRNNFKKLGIKKLISRGKSNFSGSPENRIHNINIGVQRLNNNLIKPGEIFSIAEYLTPIDASLGYKKELVIKDKKTIPEFGGGLCQISTTFYRAALLAGLPIVERAPHAYVVSYYKDGPDATIYPPHPDFRFKNDTQGHILIQTYTKNNNLYVDFYGKPTGRKVTITSPRFKTLGPEPKPIFISDPKIPRGEKKIEQKGHAPAKSEFVWTITYKNGKKYKERIVSKYKAIPAIIRVNPKDNPENKKDKK